MNKSILPLKQKRQLQQLIWEVKAGWREVNAALTYIWQSPQPALTNLDYNQYWHIRGFHTPQPRYFIMADIIQPHSRVLDIGCGEGLLLEYLSQTRHVYGHGIDISATALKMAATRQVKAFAADIRHWEVQGVYDYIILSEVIEHLADPEAIVQKLTDHFSQALIISVPNIGYYSHRLRLLFGRFPLQWGWHPAEHLRYWTVIDFVGWVQQFGLCVTQVHSSNGFPLLHRHWPNLFGNQIVFVIQKQTK
jgi:methionine biosynthesis protein MetW